MSRTAHTPVGIDDLNIDGGTLAVELSAIATARGIAGSDLLAAGFTRRSVTPPYEDAVTLGANAALPLVESAGRGAFELLIVATESGVDHGKPLSTYIHRYLGLDTRCRNFEVKHACYGGTAAIQLAAAWVRSGAVPGGKALVVMTDLARRHFGDLAELTAGSGAVAAVISAEPRILEIEPASGYASREVYDVARPSPTGEWGDAVLSIAAYLDLIEEAWAGYRRATGTTEAIDRHFRYVLYHTPLVSLARRIHGLLLEMDRDDVTPADAGESFDRAVVPALGYARELANIYSGSVYALLAGLVDGTPELAPGTRIGICSYGSGSCAEVYGGCLAPAARAMLARRRIGAHLAERAVVDVEHYERLVLEGEAMLVAEDYEPGWDLPPDLFRRSHEGGGRLVLERIQNHHRRYVWRGCA